MRITDIDHRSIGQYHAAQILDQQSTQAEQIAHMNDIAARCVRLLDQYKDDTTPFAIAYCEYLRGVLSRCD
jgi:hypothetical protein